MPTEEELLEKVSKAVEVYSNNSPLRALVSGIPFVGAGIDVVISTEGQKIVQRRITFLITQLQSEFRTIDERFINKEFLKSEEFFDLLVRIFEASAKMRYNEKIKIFAKILRNSIIDQNHIKYRPEDYTNILSELSLQELELAKNIYSSQEGIPYNEDECDLAWATRCGWERIIESIPSGDSNFLLKRLERTGLITEIVGMYLGYTGQVYKITDTFRKMMNFINYE